MFLHMVKSFAAVDPLFFFNLLLIFVFCIVPRKLKRDADTHSCQDDLDKLVKLSDKWLVYA